MVIKPFHFASFPELIYGEGTLSKLSDHSLYKNTKKMALIVGGKSFVNSNQFEILNNRLLKDKVHVEVVRVKHEPSPSFIDQQVKILKPLDIDLVVAIGGGSVMDAGKAISAMLLQNDSVMAYLEGVGEGKKHNGLKVPMIAVPTTSGTGSEATKNAVLSQVGQNGFKKSLRHDNFVPNVAILDPELMVTCPQSVTVASGLDALTQLLGAYVSTQATPLTDALALSGIERFQEGFIGVCTNASADINLRGHMAYASLMSGIVLANAGLGIVHGFASSVGGYFDIPHGVVCGTLLGEAVKLNIQLMNQDKDKYNEALKKYAKVGSLLTGSDENDIEQSCQELVKQLQGWIKDLKVQKLSEFGITPAHFEKIVKITSNKNNPIPLTKDQMITILEKRL